MWNIKKITILLCFLSLVAFISCSAEDKTGSPKPEGETETGILTKKFPIPSGKYKDDNITEVTKVNHDDSKRATYIEGYANDDEYFSFGISASLKYNKSKKYEALDITVEDMLDNIYNPVIIYYHTTQTLEITFEVINYDTTNTCSFKGVKQP